MNWKASLGTIGVVVLAMAAGSVMLSQQTQADRRLPDGSMSPLGELLKRRFGPEVRASYEARVAECMAATGLKYIPGTLSTEVTEQWDATSPQFAEQYGLGVSNRPSAPGAPVVSALNAGTNITPEYVRALMGAVQPGTRSTSGCMAQAGHQTWGDFEWAELQPMLAELNAQILSDPEVVQATALWSQCMGSNGFEYSSYQEMFDDFAGRLERAGSGTALKDLRSEEITVAKQAAACYEQHVREVQQRVRAGYELQFIAEHPQLAQP